VTARVTLPARVLAVTPSLGAGSPHPTGPAPVGRVAAAEPDIVTASIVEDDEPQPVPRQRAIGVRAAPVVEYITVPGVEPPAGIRRPAATPPVPPVPPKMPAAPARAATPATTPVPPHTPITAWQAPAPAPTPAAWAAADPEPAVRGGVLDDARAGVDGFDRSRGGFDRTRNGLTKRPQRNRTGGATQSSASGATVGGGFIAGDTPTTRVPAAPVGGAAPRASTPVGDDSPERVRDRMLSLRDGFQRKEREKASDER
jgi:hypothetical protein